MRRASKKKDFFLEKKVWFVLIGGYTHNISSGETPLHFAARTGSRGAIELLLSAGANPCIEGLSMLLLILSPLWCSYRLVTLTKLSSNATHHSRRPLSHIGNFGTALSVAQNFHQAHVLDLLKEGRDG